VVHDQRLRLAQWSGASIEREGTHHGAHRFPLHQGPVKNSPKIRAVPATYLAEVIRQGRIEEGKLATHPSKVGREVRHTIFPELSDEEPPFSVCLVHRDDKFAKEVLAVVLYGIEPDAFKWKYGGEPFAPG
jgi:hypothetical protein